MSRRERQVLQALLDLGGEAYALPIVQAIDKREGNAMGWRQLLFGFSFGSLHHRRGTAGNEGSRDEDRTGGKCEVRRGEDRINKNGWFSSQPGERRTEKTSGGPMRTVRKSYVILLLLPLLPTAVKPLLPWRYNASASLPIGYYWKGSKERAVKGSLVSFCLPHEVGALARERGYVGFGLCPGWAAMLLKPIAAVEGDVVEVKPEGVSINGMSIPNTPVFDTDSKGRPHHYQFLGSGTVPHGYVFLLAPDHARSFDSRYWGLLAKNEIVETMEAAWTWRR